MRAIASRFLSHRAVRFVLVGGLNTAFGYAVFAALVLLGMSSGLALLFATLCGVVFNFFTTGRIVFKSRNRWLFPAFTAGYAVSYLFNLAGLSLLEHFGMDSLVAQALCLLPTVVLSFFMMKTFVFRNRPAQ